LFPKKNPLRDLCVLRVLCGSNSVFQIPLLASGIWYLVSGIWHHDLAMSNGSKAWRASYVALARCGELGERVRKLDALLSDCTVCPHECRVDRGREFGTCATGTEAVVASWSPHHGEEPVISCRRGSGTVFLANCNLRCAFCQNHDISQRPRDFVRREIPAEELATIFIDLQDRGCHNINWVSPSHQVPQLVRALEVAARRGLELPIVYNTNGYDSVDVLRLLDGMVDIYMPDLKYADPGTGCRLSGIEDYPQRARAALAEMYRQVGDTWDLGPEGELQRGLLVRMLVLPEGLAGIAENLEWISQHLSPKVAISLLAQYHPAHRVPRTPDLADLNRAVSRDEWRQAVAALTEHMEGDRHHVQGVASQN
jgi:putative pyruvate formate lyase activating enzyme